MQTVHRYGECWQPGETRGPKDGRLPLVIQSKFESCVCLGWETSRSTRRAASQWLVRSCHRGVSIGVAAVSLCMCTRVHDHARQHVHGDRRIVVPSNRSLIGAPARRATKVSLKIFSLQLLMLMKQFALRCAYVCYHGAFQQSSHVQPRAGGGGAPTSELFRKCVFRIAPKQ